MSRSKQQSFEKIPWRHRYSHGGSLRQQRAGRSARPLSTRDSIHLVLKANREVVRGGFRQSRRFALIHHLVQKYKFKFYVKVEQISIQGDHLHLLIRTTRRSNYQSFFRVVAGQIAQRFEKEGLLTLAVTDTPKKSWGERKNGNPEGGSRANSGNQSGSSGIQKSAQPAPQRKQRETFKVTDTPENPSLHKRAGGFKRSHMEVGEQTKVSGQEFGEQTKFGNSSKPEETPRRKPLTKLWKYRPFTRVVKSWRAYQTVRDYIQLNEKEAIGEIKYQKRRLKGLSSSEWEILWS